MEHKESSIWKAKAQGDYTHVMEERDGEFGSRALNGDGEMTDLIHTSVYFQLASPAYDFYPIQHHDTLMPSLWFNQLECSGIFLTVSGFLIPHIPFFFFFKF